MNKVAQLSPEKLYQLFSETAAQRGITQSIVEKDFWVTWVLGKLFADEKLSKILMFKGGTSLSKVFGVIERFSEDIDLVLDWQTLTNVDPLDDRSKTKQEKLNSEVNDRAKEYIKDELLPYIASLLEPLCQCEIGDDAFSINVTYPSSFKDQYLRSEILLEIGPLASWLPYAQYKIRSIASDSFERLFAEPTCSVNAIVAERTFWEKATILHHEANRPEASPIPSRYSRHYYDLAMMTNSSIKEKALKDLELLQNVVEFKKKFYSRAWAQYDDVPRGALKLLPPKYRLKELKNDYVAMRSMIFGDYPDFDTIMDTLKDLEKVINQLSLNEKSIIEGDTYERRI